MLAKCLLPAALLAAVPVAFAQQAQPVAPASIGHAQTAAQQLTPQQIAAIKQFRMQMAQRAEQVAVQVDQGKIGDVWDQSSSVMKQSGVRDQFVSQISADRAKLGAVVSRKVAREFRIEYRPGGPMPAGQYFNVVFATEFGNGKQPHFEEVSFHFDSDKTWRTSGYTVNPPKAAQPAKKTQ